MVKVGIHRARVVALVFALCAFLALWPSGKAYATPQFARETMLPCGACHAHVPMLNEFGQQFYANGFRLLKSPKAKTLPLWAEVVASGKTSRSLGDSIPISWAASKIASYGTLDKTSLLYHFEFRPTNGITTFYALQPIANHFTVEAGEFAVLSQFDPRLDVALSRPVVLNPGGAGSFGNGKFGPFDPSGNVYGVRATASLTHGSAMPYSDGWMVSAAVPFSGEVPCTGQPDFKHEPSGAFVETFYRKGMNSYGVDVFSGRDGRSYYGAQAQYKFGPLYFQGGAAHACFLGTDTDLFSVGATWTPTYDKALAFRIDDQDGFVNYVPTASYLLTGKKAGAIRLAVESIISKDVAPTTSFYISLKY